MGRCEKLRAAKPRVRAMAEVVEEFSDIEYSDEEAQPQVGRFAKARGRTERSNYREDVQRERSNLRAAAEYSESLVNLSDNECSDEPSDNECDEEEDSPNQLPSKATRGLATMGTHNKQPGPPRSGDRRKRNRPLPARAESSDKLVLTEQDGSAGSSCRPKQLLRALVVTGTTTVIGAAVLLGFVSYQQSELQDPTTVGGEMQQNSVTMSSVESLPAGSDGIDPAVPNWLLPPPPPRRHKLPVRKSGGGVASPPNSPPPPSPFPPPPPSPFPPPLPPQPSPPPPLQPPTPLPPSPSPPPPPPPPSPPPPSPSPPPPPLSPTPLPPPPPDPRYSTETCRRLLSDPDHLFRRMWGIYPRTQNHRGVGACWDVDREHDDWNVQADQYFDDIMRGEHCEDTDWYENSPTNNHGWFGGDHNPALLGFDNDLENKCKYEAENCDAAQYNVLNMFGHIMYNSCRNFEWQMCAVHGKLARQGSRHIVFAWPPNILSDDPEQGVFGTCHGFTDNACNAPWEGFANDDIYYLEVCLFSQVCANSDELFALEAGQYFTCEFDAGAFFELKGWLLDGPNHEG